MAITTYAQLQTAAGNWLDRSDLTARIPEFITLAEARFNREIRTTDMLTRDTSFTVDSQYETLPTNFLGVKRFTISGSPVVRLEFLVPDVLDDKREQYTASGKPRYYSVVGDSFEFLPTPDTSYTGLVTYYSRLTALSDSNTSNWLLASHPDIYLFGALLEAEPYLKNDERVGLWAQRLATALRELRVEDQRRSIGGTPTVRTRRIG